MAYNVPAIARNADDITGAFEGVLLGNAAGF